MRLDPGLCRNNEAGPFFRPIPIESPAIFIDCLRLKAVLRKVYSWL